MHKQREKSRQPKEGSKRIDLRPQIKSKTEGKEFTRARFWEKHLEVGNELRYRLELAGSVGIHRLYQNDIDSIKLNGKMSVAVTNIVASGAYADDIESGDDLIYSGQGGNVVEKDKEPEDQKLEKGNLALKNSISANTRSGSRCSWMEGEDC
ncbi:histone-lysine N-methyltransferase, H3 lysine-9 specific SUVH5-like [Primulina huaijiensis]|uniref:histone-lysine N-methyltransferase, H3 lysine-9 specific SUVH5-like n=1 Tax=Primulina huaijiensis TaxID=1492673 RepID=UPI003CC79519